MKISNNNEIIINDAIRKSMNNAHKGSGGLNLIDGDYLDIYVNSFYDRTPQDKFINTAFSSILYLDTYKIVADRVKKGIANEYEMNIYNQLASITSFDELKKYYQEDISKVLAGFSKVSEFMNLPGLTKISIFKNLTREENARLNEVTPLHQYDIDKYTITVDKDYIYNFYVKYTKYLNNKFNKNTMRPVVALISNYIKDSYFMNPTETKELIGTITEDVFNNIESYLKRFPTELTTFDTLSKEYQENQNNYTNLCLRDLDIMELTLGLFFDMKDNKIIKGKTYDKK